jgi:general secretion pathway protein D
MISDVVRTRLRLLGTAAALTALASCAASTTVRRAHDAERVRDYDAAVVEYTKAVRLRPNDAHLKRQLEAARLHAAEFHFQRGRRQAAVGKFDEALVEYQIAWELNPTNGELEQELRATRVKLRNKVTVREGKTELQSLVERARDLPPPGLDLPQGIRIPDDFRSSADTSSRMLFTALARFAGINIIFDSAFRDATVTVDLHRLPFDEALNALATSTHNFYRVTAQRTITIIPDTPAKRREYEEEIVRTFYLSNADLKETLDVLRVVVDLRRLAPITATNAITIKDTPERIAAAARVISAIDKARPEVIIDTELLEVDRNKLLEYGLQLASSAGTSVSPGIDGRAAIDETDLTLRTIRSLTSSDVFLSGVPALYYRLLKSDTATRTLANPRIRTSEGIAASAKFGDRVPVPVTTFAPIAAGGVQTQPITSFTYENIGVNIDITPRTHHDDDVTLALRVEVSSVSGTGFGNLPTFGNRQISTQIRLRDGETNMLAGLIRDDERRILEGVPGLSDLPVVGRMFARNRTERQETDIVLMLTPHIERILDLTEADLRPFRVGRDSGAPLVEIPGVDRDEPAPATPTTTTSVPGAVTQPAPPPGSPMAPILPPPPPRPTTTTTTSVPRR